MAGYQSESLNKSKNYEGNTYSKIDDGNSDRKGNFKSMDIESSVSVINDNSYFKMNKSKQFIGIIAIIISSILAYFIYNSNSTFVPPVKTESTAKFDQLGRYVMSNFDSSKPMSDFLNGLGGVWGVPMWAFYVNRGQGIASFGRQNKDGSIQKFVTAEKAYQQTPFTGFRTFIRGERDGKAFNHMPFFPETSSSISPRDTEVSRDLMIGQNEMEIQEIEPSIGLKTNILYFSPPDEDYPSLIRKVTFSNLDASSDLVIDVLDGLAKLIPAGFSNGGIDAMGRTLEAYMRVYNVQLSITEPFFHASQSTADTAQVSQIIDGQFVVSFIDGDENDVGSDGLFIKLDIIVDPSVVFDTDTSLINPKGFLDAQDLNSLLKGPQGTTARTPCAFAGTTLTIPAGKSISITSVYGHSDDLQSFINVISPKVRTPGYVAKKRTEALKLVQDITKAVSTTTSSHIFNDYIKQDYLDNVLRGGLPVVLGDLEDPKIFHTFSRIHGDIERDYNYFQIDTTYYSQGPGNFRDVAQNRRLDVLLSPQVKDFNVRMFLSFVQADAYNPLTVASTLFKIPESFLDSLIASLDVKDNREDAVKIALSKAFRPGQFFMDMRSWKVKFGLDRDTVLNKITAASKQYFAAQFAQNAFWADHWTYTLDLVNNYLAVYPDKEEYLLWDSEPVPFFLSPAYVLPRKDRFSLVDNPKHPGTSTIRVYKPLVIWGEPTFNQNLNDELLAVSKSTDYVGDAGGAGSQWMRDTDKNTFKVSVGAKLLMLGIIKFSTLDPYGMGVEMEGGKPGWNDAMNGLPGILGSGMPETYEMLQILKFMHSSLVKYPKAIELPIEFVTFLKSMDEALQGYESSSKNQEADLNYWDASNTARETYRAEVMIRFLGTKEPLSASYLIDLLTKMENKVQSGITKALSTNGGYSPTYFSYECTEYKILTPTMITIPAQPDKVQPLNFVQHSLPLFLEGPTRHLKTIDSINERRDVYQRTRNSNLYDEPLQMYTLSESLENMGSDVGRMVAFSAGWLENQSVWLHMSYKFYLELLRGGLYEEFFTEISTGLVPFMNSEVYARSPLEAASFIVSSAFPDKKLHGQGFLARLSGSTAEFLSMWAIMMGGEKPFSINSDTKTLQLTLSPIIPGWLFPENGKLSFTFLGSIAVTYVNPDRKDTWKMKPKSASIIDKNGVVEQFEGGVFNEEIALKVRKLQVAFITIHYNTI